MFWTTRVELMRIMYNRSHVSIMKLMESVVLYLSNNIAESEVVKAISNVMKDNVKVD